MTWFLVNAFTLVVVLALAWLSWPVDPTPRSTALRTTIYAPGKDS